MPLLDFGQFSYYPAMCCSDGEHRGYRALSPTDRAALLPIFELGQHKHAPDFVRSVEIIRSSADGRPYVLDLSKMPSPAAYVPRTGETPKSILEAESTQKYNAALNGLLDSTDGFANWRKLLQSFPDCIPAIQFSDASVQADSIIRQCDRLSKDWDCLAIRFSADDDPAILAIISALVAALSDPSRLLIVIDCGQGRRLGTRGDFAAASYAKISNSVSIEKQPFLRVVCLSNSFPDGGGLAVGLKEYEACEWDIWRAAREVGPISFGDYTAVNRKKKANTFVPGDSVPTITYPVDEGWLIYRHNNTNDNDGYIRGSMEIISHAKYPPPLETSGRELIERAANSDLTDANSSRFWIGSKVNLHLHRQLRKAAETIRAYVADDDF